LSGSNVSNKADLAASFGKAAQKYDDAARLQKKVGSHLLSLVKLRAKRAAGSFSNVVDLGCGTGYFSGDLYACFKPEKLILADISRPMLDFAFEKLSSDYQQQQNGLGGVHRVQLDAEQLPFGGDCLSLVFSSLAVQWVGDLERTINGLYGALESNGLLAFSTLVDGTLFELKSSWAHVDSQKHVNDFLSYEHCCELVKQSGFEMLVAEECLEVIPYEQPIHLMKDLKAIGAHNIAQGRPTKLTGKSKLSRVLREYERFRRPDGIVPATYRVAYFVLRKR